MQYNASLCAEWTQKATERGSKFILAVSINSLSQLDLYASKELTPEKIAQQLRAIADKLEKQKSVPDGA